LWVAGITFVATWIGFVYVAFITECFCPVYGWLASASFIANGSGAGCIETGTMGTTGEKIKIPLNELYSN